MPTDIATMKTRIVREIGGRTDLTADISDAIQDAIDAYSEDRFYFNETRDLVTFPTVDGQEFYTATDNPRIPDILAWDYVMKVVGINSMYLSYIRPEVMEDVSNSGTFRGEPYEYTYYDRKIRLFPIPNMVVTIRIGCHYKLAPPTSDTDATNAWIIEAERLIRSRAKFILATQVTLDQAMASAMSPEDGEAARAFDELKSRTNLQTGTGTIMAVQF